MATLAKEQQSRLIRELDVMYNPVFLVCDGYLICAGMERVRKNQLGIVVYVNESIDPDWATGESEESRRFWCRRERYLYSAQRRKSIEKQMGKRWCKRHGVYDKQVYFDFVWVRPAPFIRHIIKMNESVEVIDIKEYKRRLNDLSMANPTRSLKEAAS